MSITLQPATLDGRWGDNEAMLAFRDGRLFAVLCHLGELHDGLSGHWFVESVFGDQKMLAGQTFGSLDEFEAEVTTSGR